MDNINQHYYRQFISKLKILSIRAEYNGQINQAKYYKDTYKKLEYIKEKTHLALISEDSKDKTAYREIVNMIEEKGEIKDDEILNVIKDIESICNKYKIEYKENQSKEEIER